MAKNILMSRFSLAIARQVIAGRIRINQCRMTSDDANDKMGELQRSRFKTSINTESVDQRKARLVYQSRKRGNLENGILLSTFADEYMDNLSDEQVISYDALINLCESDWDLYYWMTGAMEAPKEFQSDVLSMLREHTKNKGNNMRNQQPPVRPPKRMCN